MSQEGVERLLGRLLTDHRFLQRGMKSVAAVCLEAGFELSDKELALIRRQDLIRIELVAERLDGRIRRF